jgi:hypothetical protein
MCKTELVDLEDQCCCPVPLMFGLESWVIANRGGHHCDESRSRDEWIPISVLGQSHLASAPSFEGVLLTVWFCEPLVRSNTDRRWRHVDNWRRLMDNIHDAFRGNIRMNAGARHVQITLIRMRGGQRVCTEVERASPLPRCRARLQRLKHEWGPTDERSMRGAERPMTACSRRIVWDPSRARTAKG